MKDNIVEFKNHEDFNTVISAMTQKIFSDLSVIYSNHLS